MRQHKKIILLIGITILSILTGCVNSSKENYNITEDLIENKEEITRESIEEIKEKEDKKYIKKNKTKITEIKGKDVKNIKDKQYILYFGSEYCGACKEYNKVVKDIIKEDIIKIYYIDVILEENKEIINKEMVDETPTILFMEKGEMKDWMIGNRTLKDTKEFINKNK